MDFLKIRRKAKERAASVAAAATRAPAVEAEPKDGPGRRAVLDPAPAECASTARAEATTVPPPVDSARPVRHPAGSPEALRLEAELGSRVAALPHAADSRFVTWRPDAGGFPELAAIHPIEDDRQLPVREGARPVAQLAPLDEFFYREDEAAPEPGLLAPSAIGAATLAPVAPEEYLIFRLAGEAYGVEIGQVIEVLRTPLITEVPRAPADVRGVISVRGEVVTVIDPRGRLGLDRAEGPPAGRVVIVDDGGGACGLLVEGVAGVVRLPRGALEPCPQALGSVGGDLYLGIGRERDRLFLVLDARVLLRPLRRAAEARLG
jgi:purine-binding chemotaxis protein CheW